MADVIRFPNSRIVVGPKVEHYVPTSVYMGNGTQWRELDELRQKGWLDERE